MQLKRIEAKMNTMASAATVEEKHGLMQQLQLECCKP